MNLKALLKDIFEKFWHQYFCVFAWIVSLIFLLHNLITFSKLKKSWKITVFCYLSKSMLTSSHFRQHLGSKRYVIEFTIGLAMCILRFLTLAQADQILSGGMICPPRLWLIKRPGVDRFKLSVILPLCSSQNYLNRHLICIPKFENESSEW